MVHSGSFGVYFGTTTACIAVCQDGKTDVIANDSGDRVTPSVVSFTDYDQTVGSSAKQNIPNNSANCVCNVKRLLGKTGNHPDVEAAIKSGPVKMVLKNNAPLYNVTYKEKAYQCDPIEVASVIYKKIKETAESHGGMADSHDAVITVPLSFTSNQKEASRAAATKAGFNVLRIISEPAAALLAYNIGQIEPSETCNVIVFRLGGQSLDITVMETNSGMYRVKSTFSTSQVGGHIIDSLLVEHLASEFMRTCKVDCRANRRSIDKLLIAVEKAKHILSTLGVAQCSVESLYEGIDFSCSLSRSRLDGLCAAFLQKCLEPFNELLAKADLAKDDIHSVIMCGGCSKLPTLQQQIKDFFSSAEVLSTIAPDEVIAVGAAMQASILSSQDSVNIRNVGSSYSIPCLSTNILVQVEANDGKLVKILRSFTPIPVRRQKRFHLSPLSTSISMCIMQQAENSSKITSLAQINLRDLPEGAQINTTFHLRHDGSLHVTCTEPVTGLTQDVVIDIAAAE